MAIDLFTVGAEAGSSAAEGARRATDIPVTKRLLGAEWIIAATLAALLMNPVAFADAPLPPFSDESEVRKFDWIQIASGEWLKGEFDRLHDDMVYFDSDEFDDVTIDWADVESLLPIQPVTLRLSKRRTVMGTMEMRKGKIRLPTASEILEIERGDVIGIIVGSGEDLGVMVG